MQASACTKFKSRETHFSLEKLVTNLTKAGSFDQDTAQHDQQPNSVAEHLKTLGSIHRTNQKAPRKSYWVAGTLQFLVWLLDRQVFTEQRYLLLMHYSGCLSFLKVHAQVINPFIHFAEDQQNFMSILGIQRKISMQESRSLFHSVSPS